MNKFLVKITIVSVLLASISILSLAITSLINNDKVRGQTPPPPLGQWEVIYDKTTTTPLTNIVVTGLNGDADEVYKVTWLLNQYAFPNTGGFDPINCAGCGEPSVRLNSNADPIYDVWLYEGIGNTIQPQTFTSINHGIIGGSTRGEKPQLIEATLRVKSGVPRVFSSKSTSIEGQPATTISHDDHGGVWWNTTDNVTELLFTTGVIDDIGPGSRLIVERLSSASTIISPPPTQDTTAPSTPTGLTATTISSSQIDLLWTTSIDDTGVSGYRVERCQGSGCTAFTQIASPIGTVYADTNLTASTTYQYRVLAFDVAGNLSPYSPVTSATTQTATPPTAGLLSYWSFDEGSGTTASDTSGNNHTGTLTNGATWTTGKAGNAVNLDGIDDFVDLGSFVPVSAGGARSFSTWIKLSAINKFNPIIEWGIDTSNQLFGIGVSSSNNVRIDNGAKTCNAPTVFSADTWYHIAITGSGNNMNTYTLYVNGASTPCATSSTINTATSGAIDIGNDPGIGSANELSGVIDEARIYDRALTSAEVF